AADSVLERARWDITLHALIARMSRNPVIETTFESIAALVFELMLRSLSDSNLIAASAPFHEATYEEIRARAPVRASDAMLAHHANAMRKPIRATRMVAQLPRSGLRNSGAIRDAGRRRREGGGSIASERSEQMAFAAASHPHNRAVEGVDPVAATLRQDRRGR